MIAVAVCAAPPASAWAAEAESRYAIGFGSFRVRPTAIFPTSYADRSCRQPKAFYLGMPEHLDGPGEGDRPTAGSSLLRAIHRRPAAAEAGGLVGGRLGWFHKAEETAEVLAMANRVANFRGVMLDDFFTGNTEGKPRAVVRRGVGRCAAS